MSMDALLIEIHLAIAGVKEIEPAYEAARQRVHAQVLQLRQSIGNNQDVQRQTIAYLYWFEEYVTIDAISEAFAMKPDQIRTIAYKEYPNIRCAQCSDPLIRPEHRRPVRSLLCKSCLSINRTSADQQEVEQRLVKAKVTKSKRDEQQKEREAQYQRGKEDKQAQIEKKRARIQELRAMPYRDYLLTPDWQKKRLYALKRAGGRCQVCNNPNKRLDVHHRTYERLGDELYTDLLVLCHSCHGTFHKNGKLAK